MSNILARANRAVLEQFAWSNVLIAFDYDGTLAPIVAEPIRATMRESTRILLKAVARHYPVAIISGRARADVARLLRGVGAQLIVGNHGVEPWHASRRLSAEVRRWLPILEEQLAALRGIEIEYKVFSIAIHYRHSREKKRMQLLIAKAAAALGDVRVTGGNHVVNLLPTGAPHKGSAVERARSQLGCDTAIYVGDDETDEDAFVLDQPGRLLGIRVGRSGSSAAAYHIPNQAAIDDLLHALLASRCDIEPHRRAAR